MTFDAVETSRQEGAPINLFKFTVGSATPYTWTDGVATVAYDDGGGSENYTPLAIKLPSLPSDGTLDKNELQISMPDDSGIPELFLVYPPPVAVDLVVRTGHVGESEFKLAFTGVVLSCSREGPEAILACEPVASALRRPGLRRNYQFACPYVLYNGLCTASKAAATTSVATVTVNSTDIEVASGWNGSNALTDYLGGVVEWTNADSNTEVRTILSAAATQIFLSGLIRDLTAPTAVDVVLGCNRSEDHCLNLHNVVADFGGQPHIPDENPHEVANNWY